MSACRKCIAFLVYLLGKAYRKPNRQPLSDHNEHARSEQGECCADRLVSKTRETTSARDNSFARKADMS